MGYKQMGAIFSYRYLFMRRVTSIGILLLFFGANAYGWTVLKGNLSYADVFGSIPLADPFHLLQMMAALEIPATEALVGGLIVLVFYSLIAGRAFCSWVCPVNIVTDAAEWIRRKINFRESIRMSRSTRYWALGLSIALSATLGIAAFEWISPIGMLHRGVAFGMGAGWVAIAAVFMFDAMVVRNGFCGHLCPLGGFYALTGKLSLISLRYAKDKCTDCGKCVDVCPERQVLSMVGQSSGQVPQGECTNCGRCIEVCSDDAIGFVIGYDRSSVNGSASSTGGNKDGNI
jgi:ferredoxin-type protein NapH